ncbi:ankyrin repeat domain-containing protein 45-like [Clavelina lepadiformis]|uniref:ankyrin repeat domain-containing protein 45-like n=1 Tax=Clavelina lepadiformis TaxID=159417 RepID=UPI004040F871
MKLCLAIGSKLLGTRIPVLGLIMPSLDDDNVCENEQPEVIDGGNIVFHCTLHGDHERLSKVFDDGEDQQHENATSTLNEKNYIGKTPIQLACILGRVDVLKELLKRGCDIQQSNSSGYTLMHFAACWNKRACLEVLFEAGAKIDCRTENGESVKQLALRYNHQDCVDFMDWAAARLTLVDFIAHVRAMVTDPEKLQGVKLSKEEKNTTLGSCSEKQEWLENTSDATLQDFMLKKLDLEKQVELILDKVNSPAPPTGNSGKK